MGWIAKIARVGRMVELAPPTPPTPDAPDAVVLPPTGVTGSLQLRHVDAGSCNGCELEITGAFSPVYDAERFGARLVASPRHADGLLATGVVTHNMRQPLVNAFNAAPEPKVVIAVGDCACNGGVFADGYGVAGSVGEIVPVDVAVPGCPPTPTQIIEALRTVTGR